MRNTLCLLLFLASALPAQADDSPVAAALKQPILEPDQPLAEVKAFCTARIAKMPALGTADEWRKYAEDLRQKTLDQVIFRGEAKTWRDAPLEVEWLDTIAGGPGYKIQKLRYAALPGLWIPALLYIPDNLGDAKVPACLNVNGHDPNGKAADYKQIRCINQAKRGMLALNVEWLGMGQLRSEGFVHYRANQLDLCGTSAVSVFYLAMQRGLDVLLTHANADPSRVAMAGLSGGGWQTIILSALDPRVTISNPVAGYSSFVTRAANFSDLGDTEQTPSDMAALIDYTHLTALRAPRPTLLTYNAKDDCCFMADHALQPLLDAAEPVYALLGAAKNLRWHINEDPGTHNFLLDNRQQHYRMLIDFFPRENDKDATEIASDGEVKSAEQLNVPLPKDNLDFHKLAMRLKEGLPRQHITDKTPRADFADFRAQLRDLVKFHDYKLTAEELSRTEKDGLHVVRWRVKIGDDWTLPVVELWRGEPKEIVVIAPDKGRAESAALVEQQLGIGRHVFIVDPFYLGESKISQRDQLFALLVASVGERPLGLQASQLAAVGHWVHGRAGDSKVWFLTPHPKLSLAMTVAKACDPTSITLFNQADFLWSLHHVIEKDIAVDQDPEYFCFGLLEHFDVMDMTNLSFFGQDRGAN